MTATEAGAGALPGFFRLRAHDELASTREEAKDLARAGAAEGTLIMARRQSRGRGRRGRHWISPEGNLYCSLVLRPDRPPARATEISFVAAVAVAEALGNWLAGHRIGLKWPNDVLADGAKIAGILLESERHAEATLSWLVVGLGVNLSNHPQDLGRPTTSLAALGHPGIDANLFLSRLAERFLHWYERWLGEGFGPIRDFWLSRAVGLKEPVTIGRDGNARRGIFDGLSSTGALIVRWPDGSAGAVISGEVRFDSLEREAHASGH